MLLARSEWKAQGVYEKEQIAKQDFTYNINNLAKLT